LKELATKDNKPCFLSECVLIFYAVVTFYPMMLSIGITLDACSKVKTVWERERCTQRSHFLLAIA
jgi:hypothetical protein